MRSVVKSKRGIIQPIIAVALGLVTLAIILGVGLTVLTKFAENTSGEANTTIVALIGDLGSTGLASWVPVVIALVIGVVFIGYFMGRKKGY